VFVDPEISTQADGAQSPRVPVPFPEDPYKAIRQAYLVETKTPYSPYTVASPTPLLDSTPPTHHPLTHVSPTLVPILLRTIRMAMRVPPAMSPGLSASIAEEEDEEEEDDKEEDEEINESSDSDSESEDVEDEGSTAEDEDPAVGEEGLAAGDEGPGMRVKSLSLGGDEAVPKGQSSGFVPKSKRPERVSALRQPTLTTWIDPEDGIAYIDVPAYPPPALPVQTPPSLE
ncbi:hypothetical protein Tco_1423951, partial [Tanacetum coccineum]